MAYPTSIAIATPSIRENFTGYYVSSLFNLQKICIEKGIATDLLMVGRSSLVCYARNALSSQFLYRTSASHMLFVDDDVGFDAQDVFRMLDWSHLPVVGAIYPRKQIDWEHIRAIVLSNPDLSGSELERASANYRRQFSTGDEALDMATVAGDRPFAVAHVGAGLMLVSRDILLKLIAEGRAPRAGFGLDDLADLPLHHFFRTQYLEDGMIVGEDIDFCQSVRAIGESVYACGWPHVVHTGLHDHFGSLPAAAARGVTVRV